MASELQSGAPDLEPDLEPVEPVEPVELQRRHIATTAPPVLWSRPNAVAAGVCFVVAAISAIVGLGLYQPLLSDARHVVGSGTDLGAQLGVLAELVLVVTVIGTGVSAYPVLRRVNESLSLAYVCGRLLEAAVIATGMVTVLGAVALRSDAASLTGSGADEGGLVAASGALVAIHDATFLLGPGLIIGVNTFVLAWVVRKGLLAPRWITAVGLVGGPMVLASSVAVLLGAYEQTSRYAGVAAIPVTVWEMSFAVWLIAKAGRDRGAVIATPAVTAAP